VSVPIEPIGSAPVRAIGPSRIFNSSSVYPKVCCRRCTESCAYTTCSRSGSVFRCIRPTSSQSSYGSAAASSPLICPSSTMRPAPVSTRNMWPGWSRPFCTIVAGSRSRTPASLAITTSPSAVRHQRPGRRPLRSSTAPITVPSVNATLAGPSHGSIRLAWNS
jgi:hypothetical protein